MTVQLQHRSLALIQEAHIGQERLLVISILILNTGCALWRYQFLGFLLLNSGEVK